jgi:predicted nuclease of predicted toxin-antitoxin system
MRFLADENIPRAAVEALRSAGHEVLWACESSPGAPDMELLRTANQDGLIILTLDKDFGELARASGVSRDAGVVLFRIPLPNPGQAARAIAEVLGSREDWLGHFSVVTESSVRMRALSDKVTE